MLERALPLRDQLIAVCEAYAVAKKISISTLSTQLLNGGGRLPAIAAGGDLNTGKFEEAMSWLSANWPENAVWPAEIARPNKVAA